MLNTQNPVRSRRRRNRKKKPLARDSIGLARQVLVVAKVHLFAYALSEGVYQTRVTYMKWAEMIHEKTWELLLPDIPYEAATMSELEVVSLSHKPACMRTNNHPQLVNYLVTLRGKAKERVRPLVPEIHDLQHRVTSQQDIQDNLDAFNEAYPNSFHCAVSLARVCILCRYTLLMLVCPLATSRWNPAAVITRARTSGVSLVLVSPTAPPRSLSSSRTTSTRYRSPSLRSYWHW
jgi:hypothetical protein